VSHGRPSSGVRRRLPLSVTAFIAVGVLACGSEAVIIGVEDGDAGTPAAATAPTASASASAPPLGEPDAGSNGTTLIDDAGFYPCSPDSGCPTDSVCEYPIEAGCGAPGACFQNGLQIPPPGAFTFPRRFDSRAARRLHPSGEPYSPTPPSCDAGSAEDAAAGATEQAGED
jgi:hypothetical protein